MDAVVNALSNIIDAISDFSRWLYELFMYSIGYFTAFFAAWLLRLQASFQDIYDSSLSNSINFSYKLYELVKIQEVTAAYNNLLSGDSGFYLDYFMCDTILTSVLGAYLIRFAIRRLPIIG